MYVTRAELQNAIDGLSDTDADDLAVDASNAIDLMLGARPVSEDGWKVTETDVAPWQWEKLKTATIRVAKRLHAKPDLFTAQQYETVKGPDFEMTGPKAIGLVGRLGADIWGLVANSGLGVYSGRAR
ncbi:MAG: hypothetical protein J0H98_08140 [Solirubrobacterales bacterium]|nr:hypothetical protein [Solirubrobacterales bacterium]